AGDVGALRFQPTAGSALDLGASAQAGLGLFPSPDGARVAFFAPGAAAGQLALSVAGRDGAGRTLATATLAHRPAWSDDGGRILYADGCDGAGSCALAVFDFARGASLPLGTGNPRAPLLLTGDGRWAVVGADRWVTDVDAGRV